jgi:hypothetical protein
MDWTDMAFLAGGVALGVVIAIVAFFGLVALAMPGNPGKRDPAEYEPRSRRRSVYFDPKEGPPWNRKPPIR